jgi:ElaA protein
VTTGEYLRSDGAQDDDTGPLDPLPWHVDVREGAFVGEDLGVCPQVRRAAWAELDPVTAHRIARLRIQVLVVEPGHLRAELDDLDPEDGTEHLWVPDGQIPVAYLRLVRDPDGVRALDRACSRADVRHLGLVAALVTDVVARHGADPLRARIPASTVPFLLRHGFEVVGSGTNLSDGAQVPMVRAPEVPWR